jgi:hypothetical protein
MEEQLSFIEQALHFPCLLFLTNRNRVKAAYPKISAPNKKFRIMGSPSLIQH